MQMHDIGIFRVYILTFQRWQWHCLHLIYSIYCILSHTCIIFIVGECVIILTLLLLFTFIVRAKRGTKPLRSEIISWRKRSETLCFKPTVGLFFSFGLNIKKQLSCCPVRSFVVVIFTTTVYISFTGLYIRCKIPAFVSDVDIAPWLCIYHWMPYFSVEIKEWHILWRVQSQNPLDMYNCVYLKYCRKSSLSRILKLLL